MRGDPGAPPLAAGGVINTKSTGRLRWAVSILAVLAACVHVTLPAVKIDAATVALLIIAVLPWLAPLVKAVELPGGVRIELQELQDAASRADSAGLLVEPARVEDPQQFSFEAIASRDPNLALAGLRIEIERRLDALAQANHLASDRPLGVGQLLRELANAEVLSQDERSVLSDMVSLLNEAVHGADVDSRGAEWALDVGPRLLASLDERVAESGTDYRMRSPGQNA